MADEEKVVESKGGGGLGGLLPIITLVLVVAAIGISAFSMITVMNVGKKIDDMAIAATEVEVTEGEIPVGDISTFSFTEQFIFIYPNAETGGDDNVVTNIGVGVYNPVEGEKEALEEAATVLAQLSANELIIRDGVETMMKGKSFADFQTEEAILALKEDLKLHLQGRLGTDKIIAIYFNGTLTTSR